MNKFVSAPIGEIISDYVAGLTVAAIGAKYNIPQRTVHSWLTKSGVRMRPRGVSKGHSFSEDRNAKLSKTLKGRAISDDQKKRISESHKCHFNGLNGYGHVKQHNKGYMLAYCPEHPNAHRDGYVMLHTVIMERELGRYLTRNEVVHHQNHNRKDNRIENLILMEKHDHESMHMKELHQQRREKQCNA